MNENKESINRSEKSEELQDDLRCIEMFFGEANLQPQQYSALGLAYIGDGVYDLIIRTIVLNLGNGKVRNFHKITSGIVKAESQAALMRMIEEKLTKEEQAIFHHGRNAKSATSAKNASIVDYRVATGFEALIGYLYLKHELNRALELIKYGLEKTNQLPKKL